MLRRMAKLLRFLLIALVLAAAIGPRVQAAESTAVASPRATATMVTDTDTVAPGRPIRVALRLRLAPGWHTYWHNPGDAGVAPDLSFTLPPGVTAGPIAWPAPRLEKEGPLATYAYTGEVLLPVTLRGASGRTVIQLSADWLVCANICVPESGVFRLDLPAGDGAPSAEARLFAAADARMPRPSPWQARIAPDGTLAVLGLTGVRSAWFAPEQPGQIVADAPQDFSDTPQGLFLKLRREPDFQAGASLSGVLTVRDAQGTESYLDINAGPGVVAQSDRPAPAAPAGLWRLVGLALLGGLVLNLMPCVFPVLALKTVGLAGLAGARRGQAAAHAGSYTAGVLLAFAALGGLLLLARAAGVAAGWGFQFQRPGFVAAIAWLLFAVGLNLSGVFTLEGRIAGAGQQFAARESHLGSFATGLLAVLVATPCTAPFMGAAIAGALVLPAPAALAVFLAMGLGLAAPYAALALVPGIARLLPRPGRWMEVLRQALAFPMYGAAAWLVWVMSQEAGSAGVLAVLAGGVLIALAAWVYGLSQGTEGRRRRFGQAVAAAAVLAALAVLPGIGTVSAKATPTRVATEPGAEAFSAARLAALLKEGRPVFVNATAAWCISCQLNDRVALTPRVRTAFAQRGITYLVADWTRQDAEVTTFLRAHAHEGVPLYVFYPGGGRAPVVLPQILTEAIVLDAIGAPAT
jgi:thiol:disulfide interchange protein